MSIDIISTGRYVSETKMDNHMISKIVDTDNHWIVERTGILERRISEDKTTEEIGYLACKNAIDKIAKINKKNFQEVANNIDLIVFASVSGDTKTPSSAFKVSGKLGIKNCIALDINSACSGFLYGIAVAKSMLKELGKKYAIVVGAERLSKYIDWKDRGTCILFGDGGGCAVLENTEVEGDIDLYRDVSIEVEGISLGGRFDEDEFLTIASKDEPEENEDNFIRMNGRQVYKFATEAGPRVIDELFQENKTVSKEDIEIVVPHQANIRIIKTMSQKSRIPLDKWYTNLEFYGNTSSASVPIALDEALEKMKEQKKIRILEKSASTEKIEDKTAGKKSRYILTVAFGGGLSYGGALLRIK